MHIKNVILIFAILLVTTGCTNIDADLSEAENHYFYDLDTPAGETLGTMTLVQVSEQPVKDSFGENTDEKTMKAIFEGETKLKGYYFHTMNYYGDDDRDDVVCFTEDVDSLNDSELPIAMKDKDQLGMISPEMMCFRNYDLSLKLLPDERGYAEVTLAGYTDYTPEDESDAVDEALLKSVEKNSPGQEKPIEYSS